MFSRVDLLSAIPRLTIDPTLPIEVVEFGHLDFVSPSSEQEIWAFRGSKDVFSSGLHFWVKTLQTHDWSGRDSYFLPYAESGLCEPISESEFSNVVREYSQSLRAPLPSYFDDLTGFRAALRMYADWNDVAVAAELIDTFVAFYWSTTA